MVKNPHAMWETWVQYLGWEGPLEAGMATHPSILAWRIPMDRLGSKPNKNPNPRTEEPGGLQFMGLQRVRHN